VGYINEKTGYGLDDNEGSISGRSRNISLHSVQASGPCPASYPTVQRAISSGWQEEATV